MWTGYRCSPLAGTSLLSEMGPLSPWSGRLSTGSSFPGDGRRDCRLNNWLGGAEARNGIHNDIKLLRTPVMASRPLWGMEGSPLSQQCPSSTASYLAGCLGRVSCRSCSCCLLGVGWSLYIPVSVWARGRLSRGVGERGCLPAVLSSQSPPCVEGRACCVALLFFLVMITARQRVHRVLRLLWVCTGPGALLVSSRSLGMAFINIE